MTTNPDLLARARELLAAITLFGPLPSGDMGIMYDQDGDEVLSVSARYLSISQREEVAEALVAAPALVRDLLAACEARDAEIARLRAVIVHAHALLSKDNSYVPGVNAAWMLLGDACGKVSSTDEENWNHDNR